MNFPVAKKLAMLGLVVLFSASLIVVSIGRQVLACNPADTSCASPYFKSTGSDVGTGGWFNDGTTTCSTAPTSNYQDSNYTGSGPADNRRGGIMAFAKETTPALSSNGGASDEYAAFSLGQIEGNDAKSYGFYTDGSQAKNGATYRSQLSFANFQTTFPPDYWGGLLVPSGAANPRQTTYCIPDYYSKKPASCPSLPGAPGAGKLNGSLNSSDVYCEDAPGGIDDIAPNGTVTLNPGASGKNLTVYVNGSVYIRNNITYGSTDVDHMVKFTLVVRGNIYISKDVTDLRGLYIAQPDPVNDPASVDGDTGVIWTCHDGSNAAPLYTDLAQCSNKLNVEGAFIAKQINLTRVKGDVATAPAPTSEDGLQLVRGSANIAEVINYSPDMVIGGQFFSDGTTTNDPQIESLISLPPVF